MFGFTIKQLPLEFCEKITKHLSTKSLRVSVSPCETSLVPACSVWLLTKDEKAGDLFDALVRQVKFSLNSVDNRYKSLPCIRSLR